MIESFSPDEVKRALRVNLEAPIMLARELAPGMRERGDGHLVFVSSLAGKAPSPRTALYCGTKFGLRGFALSACAPTWRALGSASRSSSRGSSARPACSPTRGQAPARAGHLDPQQVARAVVRAIERDKFEVAVAPLRQRALAHIGLASPRLAMRAITGGHRKEGARNEVAEGQAKQAIAQR